MSFSLRNSRSLGNESYDIFKISFLFLVLLNASDDYI